MGKIKNIIGLSIVYIVVALIAYALTDIYTTIGLIIISIIPFLVGVYMAHKGYSMSGEKEIPTYVYVIVFIVLGGFMGIAALLLGSTLFGKESLSRLNFGIASTIISIIVGISFFVFIVVAGIIEVSTPGGVPEDSPIAMILGLLIILGLFACVVGAGLGIAGVLKDQKKAWSIVGLILNVSIILVFVGLMILGLLAE